MKEAIYVGGENLNFKTISDFRFCMEYHGEVEFLYNGQSYSITHPEGLINVGEGYYIKEDVCYNAESHQECVDWKGKQYNTADEALEYMIDGERLRDIVTKIKVVVRTI